MSELNETAIALDRQILDPATKRYKLLLQLPSLAGACKPLRRDCENALKVAATFSGADDFSNTRAK